MSICSSELLYYRSGTVNSNTVDSKFHFIRGFCEMFSYHYRPKRSFGQGNIFTPVCHSVHRGGVWQGDPPAGWRTPRMDGEPPLAGRRTPPGWKENPPPPAGRRTPPGWKENPPRLEGEPPPGSRLRHTVYDRPVRILLECILVSYLKCMVNSYSTYFEGNSWRRMTSN